MVGFKKFSPLARAIGVTGAVVAIAGGATFAALQSQATLTNTTITSATADLRLWDGDSFEPTAPGFTITNLLPGSGSGPQAFYFQNNGTAPLAITASVPVLPSATNIAAWTDVEVDISCVGASGPVSTTLAALNSAPVSLTLTLPAGAQGDSGNPLAVGNCTADFDFNPAGVTGSSASVTAFNVVFNGTQTP